MHGGVHGGRAPCRLLMLSGGLVVCLMVLAGCGQSAGDASKASRPPAWTQQFAHAHQVAASLSDSIAGTAEQQSATQYVTLWRANHVVDECMAGHGIAWNRWRKVENVSVSDGLPNWLRQPMQPVVSESVQLQARLVRAMDVPPSDPLTGRNGRVLDRCLTMSQRTKHPEASDDEVEKLFSPAFDSSTARAFGRLIGSVTRRLPSDDRYARCMKRAGSPVHGEANDGGYNDFNIATERVRRTAPPLPDIPEQGETGSAAWQKFLGREQELLRDDASCRKAEYEKGMAALAPKLGAFRRQHAEELTRLRAHWASVDQEAQAHGWPASY
jgi:hypothetical protein